MYAIIQDGGHQYRVEQGQKVQVELKGSAEAGASVTFDKVCMVGGEGDPKIGTPYVEGASVEAKVLRPDVKGKKIDVFFYRRRKGSSRKLGHRQRYTEIEITKISG